MKTRIHFGWGSLAAIALALTAHAAISPCEIQIVEKGSGWPVPLVELRTKNGVSFVTDNAGVIAFDLPELMGKEIWFDVKGQGYEVKKDIYGSAGVRFKMEPGGRHRVEVERTIIARRLGRLTGAGLFGESQKLGREMDWKESGIVGCDSVQNTIYGGRLFWLWGDTDIPSYALGIFDSTSATTAVKPMATFEPPLRVRFDYFANDKGAPRGVAKMPGKGPTWITGYISLPDANGREHLVASYMKIRNWLEAYRWGLVAWNDSTGSFEHTFYNPAIHPEFTADDSHVLIFEGTYTAEFANRPQITPRYNYNQILYRLDLDDPRLLPAREK